MTINKTINGDEAVLSVIGRLDASNAKDLENMVKGTAAGVNRLVLDLEKLEYISSAGLRVLLIAVQLMEGRGEFLIQNPCEAVKDVFEVTGFIDILTISE